MQNKSLKIRGKPLGGDVVFVLNGAQESINFDYFLECIGDGVSIQDRNYTIIYQNEAHKDIVGDHVGEYCYRAYSFTEAVCDNCPVTLAFRDGKRHTLERATKAPAGMRYVEITASPLKNTSGEIIAAIEVVRDISKRKKADEELQKAQRLESVGLLAGGIAHDFNNILTAILGNIEVGKMLLKPEDKALARLANAEEAVVRARGITQQLLTFSKGGAPVKKTACVQHLLRESVEFVLRGSNVKSEFSFPDDLWLTEVDENQINQVVHNLAINGAQAMPGGGILRVVAVNAPIDPGNPYDLPAGKYVRIRMTDQGTGIPRKYRKRIFDPYFTTKKGGTGLGLAISYSVMKRHGGALVLDSSSAKGCCFSLFLPASGKRLTAPPTEKASKPSQASGRILVMDDDRTVTEIAADLLLLLGYRVLTARDGEEAVTAYERALKEGDPFDAVITDLTVPGGMGGMEAVGRLHEVDPEARVLVSSGYANDPIMSHYAEYGFKGVIPKPYKLAELGKALQEVIPGQEG